MALAAVTESDFGFKPNLKTAFLNALQSLV